MPSNLPRFTLRISNELREKVRKLAIINNRSTNKEIEYVLKEYIEKNSNKF